MPPVDSRSETGELEVGAHAQFASLVESIGVKRFAASLDLSTRQVNRILSGAQPNPVERLLRCLQAVDPEAGDRALDFICREMGGHFVRHVGHDESITEAVRECAEAIAAMSDGSLEEPEEREIREAISALSSVLDAVARRRADD